MLSERFIAALDSTSVYKGWRNRETFIQCQWVVRLWEKKGIWINVFDCFSFMKGRQYKK